MPRLFDANCEKSHIRLQISLCLNKFVDKMVFLDAPHFEVLCGF